jgi:hypothetical protein
MSEAKAEEVPALPLATRRKALGILIPLINMPLFALNLYETIVMAFAGTPLNSLDFLNSVVFTFITLGLGLLLPWWTPVYPSKYRLDGSGLRISRFLKKTLVIPYRRIERAEVYIREEGKISEEADKYAKDSAANLRKTGFKFNDYTNAESNIVLLISGNKIYMMSPEKPKSFVKSLKKRAPKLTVKLVELNERGKTVQELA